MHANYQCVDLIVTQLMDVFEDVPCELVDGNPHFDATQSWEGLDDRIALGFNQAAVPDAKTLHILVPEHK